MKHCGVGVGAQRLDQLRRRRRDAGGEAVPPLGSDLRHPLGVAEHRLAGELARTEPLPAQAVGQQTELVAPPPRGGAQRGEGVEQADVLGLGHGVVADRHQLARHVAHQQGDAPPVATPRRGTEGGVVDRRRGDVHQPGFPRPSRPATDVAGHPHREVVVGVHVLDHAPLAVDLHLLELRARPRLGGLERLAAGTGQQLVHRGGQGPADELDGAPRPARRWRSHGAHCDAPISASSDAGQRPPQNTVSVTIRPSSSRCST